MIVALANHKGGTGKTTTTINLGAALSILGKKVLLIDLDPQGNLSYSLGISEENLDISYILSGEKEFEEVVIQVENMDVLPANMRLADIELSMYSVENREYELKELLKTVQSNYDYILIDCPPARSLLTINALTAADYVISTILLDVLSIQGLLHIITTIQEIKQVLNEKLNFLGILAVHVDMRKKLSKEVVNFISKHYDYAFFDTSIRSNVKIAEAPSHGQSVFAYAPQSNGAKEYLLLAEEIISLNSN